MLQDIPCNVDYRRGWWRAALPFLGVVAKADGPYAGVVDDVVGDHAAAATLEPWIAVGIVGIQIADHGHIGDVVMDQRAHRMLALDMGRVDQTLGNDVVRQGDAVCRAHRAIVALAGNGKVLVRAPAYRAMIDDHVPGIFTFDGDIAFVIAFLRQTGITHADAQVLHYHVMSADLHAGADQGDAGPGGKFARRSSRRVRE